MMVNHQIFSFIGKIQAVCTKEKVISKVIHSYYGVDQLNFIKHPLFVSNPVPSTYVEGNSKSGLKSGYVE